MFLLYQLDIISMNDCFPSGFVHIMFIWWVANTVQMFYITASHNNSFCVNDVRIFVHA